MTAGFIRYSLAAACALAACGRDYGAELAGAWRATTLLEEGDTVAVDLSDVGIAFRPGGRYVYTSTLDHEEQGTYRVDGALLLTTPEGQDTIADRPVEIALLERDVLHLNMQEGDKARVLQFERVAGAAEPAPAE